jgi:hypothetical protein
MTQMKKITLSFFVLFLSFFSIAQVPGYMGKRFSIGYSNYLFPRIPVLSSALGFTEDFISTEHLFNSTHCLDMDYALSSRVSLCLSGQFSKLDFISYKSIVHATVAGRSNDIQYIPKSRQDMQLRTTNISVGFKFFKERYLNPYGRYRKVELILMMNRINMDENGFYSIMYDYYNGNKVEPYPLYGEAGKFNSIALAYTMGKQRIFFNKLILDWGLRLGLNYSYVYSNLNPFEFLRNIDNGNTEDTLEKRLKDQANARTWGAQLVNVHLGLRFLAF